MRNASFSVGFALLLNLVSMTGKTKSLKTGARGNLVTRTNNSMKLKTNSRGYENGKFVPYVTGGSWRFHETEGATGPSKFETKRKETSHKKEDVDEEPFLRIDNLANEYNSSTNSNLSMSSNRRNRLPDKSDDTLNSGGENGFAHIKNNSNHSVKYSRPSILSSVVQLSIGCTGTLVTSRHVLTAAHCIHDGLKFRKAAKKLKIYAANDLKWFPFSVKKMQVPKMWITLSRNLKLIERTAFDYAIVTLKLPVPQYRRVHFDTPRLKRNKMGGSSTKRPIVRFFSFRTIPLLKPRKVLKQTRCRVQAVSKNLIISNCGAIKGDSGSAMLINHDDYRLRISGVLSSILSIPGGLITVAARITEYKLNDICLMLSRGRVLHPDCWKLISRVY